MKSYDNTIKYYELLMYYKDTSIYKKYSLPDGFHDTFIQELNKRCIFKFILLSQSIFTAIPLTRASIASIVRFSQPVFSNILCM